MQERHDVSVVSRERDGEGSERLRADDELSFVDRAWRSSTTLIQPPCAAPNESICTSDAGETAEVGTASRNLRTPARWHLVKNSNSVGTSQRTWGNGHQCSNHREGDAVIVVLERHLCEEGKGEADVSGDNTVRNSEVSECRELLQQLPRRFREFANIETSDAREERWRQCLTETLLAIASRYAERQGLKVL